MKLDILLSEYGGLTAGMVGESILLFVARKSKTGDCSARLLTFLNLGCFLGAYSFYDLSFTSQYLSFKQCQFCYTRISNV